MRLFRDFRESRNAEDTEHHSPFRAFCDQQEPSELRIPWVWNPPYDSSLRPPRPSVSSAFRFYGPFIPG